MPAAQNLYTIQLLPARPRPRRDGKPVSCSLVDLLLVATDKPLHCTTRACALYFVLHTLFDTSALMKGSIWGYIRRGTDRTSTGAGVEFPVGITRRRMPRVFLELALFLKK